MTSVFVLSLGFFSRPSAAITFFGEMPKGLVEINDFRYPVYVFVPPGLDQFLYNSMVWLIPDSSEKPDELVQNWIEVAKKKKLIVAVPTLQLQRDDVPYQADQWMLKVKKDLTQRYNVQRTYIVGKGEGAHYASYLAMQHPSEFAGAGLLSGSWVGPFEKLTHLSVGPSGQIPFFISLYAPDAELMKQTEVRAYQFTAKGYPIYLEKFDATEQVDAVELETRMMDWLQKKAETWTQVVAKNGKTKKEKFFKWMGEFFSAPSH